MAGGQISVQISVDTGDATDKLGRLREQAATLGPASVVIVRAVQTCTACPSQWDAWDNTGGYWYLRYRSGQGTMSAFEGRTDTPLSFDTGEEYGGSISLAEFCQRIGVTLALNGGAR
jgi:hypothetical protein